MDSKYLELDFFGTQPPRTLMNGDGLDGFTGSPRDAHPAHRSPAMFFGSFVYPEKMENIRKIEPDSKSGKLQFYLFGQEQTADRKTTHWSPLVGYQSIGPWIWPFLEVEKLGPKCGRSHKICNSEETARKPPEDAG